MIEPIEPALHAGNLVMNRRVLAGSLIGGIAETQEVLEFCAEHSISCDIEMLDIKNINEAYSHMIARDVKYCFVIDMATLKSINPDNPFASQQMHDMSIRYRLLNRYNG